MLLTNIKQAKTFFVQKIITQSQKERISLSEAELYMINWSETEDGFEINNELIEKFNANASAVEFEKKIALLIKHAYEADIRNDTNMRQMYQNAYEVLGGGDNYLRAIMDTAFMGLPVRSSP